MDLNQIVNQAEELVPILKAIEMSDKVKYLGINLYCFDQLIENTEKIDSMKHIPGYDFISRHFNLKNPSAVSGLFLRRAEAKEGLNDLEGALEDLEKSITLNSEPKENYNAYILIAGVKSKLGNHSEALIDISKVIDLKFDDLDMQGEVYLERALIKTGAEDYKGAFEDYNQAIQLFSEPINIVTKERVTVKNLLTSDEVHIPAETEMCIGKNRKKIGKAYGLLGVAKWKAEKKSEALEYLDKALEFDPKGEQNYYFRGAIHYTLGELDKAVSDLDEAIEQAPRLSWAHVYLGFALLRSGKKSLAEMHLNLSEELGYQDSELYLFKGEELTNLGEFEGAKKALDKVLELDPNSARAHSTYGYWGIHAGEYDAAIQHYNKAIGFGMESTPHCCIGIALMGKDQNELAKTHFEKKLELFESIQDKTKKDYLGAIIAEQGLVKLGYNAKGIETSAIQEKHITSDEINATPLVKLLTGL